ncbi:MAG TPA: glutamyl-tRNA reductase [Spirochaetia bacterium]|nr:MAG: glutamyl-tRNA reductase [Spirochaetes bacterium GWB1_36_13]HCL57144.1 glutamyl-tRNA reductase [Spirochaetia bacterium]
MILFKGLDHSFSIEEREAYQKKFFYSSLPENYVLLKTCNRVEMYYDIPEKSFSHQEPETVRHLFRLASGLESALIGENQVMHQVKKAYREAVQEKRISSGLHILFQSALRAGKKVRTLTGIGKGAMSHSQAVVEIIKKRNLSLKDMRITMIGVHQMNRNIVRYLVKDGCQTIFLGNRTFEKSKALADELGCSAFPLNFLKNILKQTDLLITATSAPHFIVRKEDFPQNKKMIIFDLAVPRDVEEAVGSITGVELYNISEVEKKQEQNLEKRRNEIHQAEKLIQFEVSHFMKKIGKSVFYEK